MTRPDVVLVERVRVPASLVKSLAMTCVAGQPAGPGGPRKRGRDCGCEDHGRGVFFSSAEGGVSGPFMRIVNAQSRARVCRTVPPPRRVRREDAGRSTGIAGEGFGKAKRAH